jgi:hypothetical protein
LCQRKEEDWGEEEIGARRNDGKRFATIAAGYVRDKKLSDHVKVLIGQAKKLGASRFDGRLKAELQT